MPIVGIGLPGFVSGGRFGLWRGMMARWGALVLVGMLAVAGVRAADPVDFGASRLAVVTAQGRFVFDVEVADTPEQRAQGLQGRRGLAPSAGMIFDFGVSRPVFMWMKNTPTPLDMLFIAADGRIVNIAPHTQPFSVATFGSAGPVRYVLEVAAGTAARLGVKPGDRVIYPLEKDAP